MEQQTTQEYLNENEISLKDFLNIVVAKLNFYEGERLKKDGYTNECFFNKNGSLTDNYEITLKEKQKYFYIDFGTSGGFMIAKEQIKTKHYGIYEKGSIFNIKGYGTPNFLKYYGLIFEIDIKKLHSLRFDYRN